MPAYGGYSVRQRAADLAQRLRRSSAVHVVTHIDADGITAGAIASETLRRLGKQYTIECVKQLDETVITKLLNENHELVWFTDLGSGISTQYPEMNKVITDHHECPPDSNLSFHFNPHLFGHDGSYELSGAGATYLVAKQVDGHNTDLSSLAIVGAIGDLQDRRFCALHGLNTEIVKDGRDAGVLHTIQDLRYFGKETRPLAKLLQYASDPLIPGISGREDACVAFLQELQIRLKDGDTWRTWVTLDKDEKRTIISNIVQMLLVKGFGYQTATRVLGESYLLSREQPGTELHDAKEFATLLNSTARYGQYEVGLQVCLGDRGKWLKEALSLLKGHRHNLVEGLQFAREEKIQKRAHLQYFHAGDGIRDTIIGIVTNMMLNAEETDKDLPLLGFAHTENGEVKVSARATQALVDRGLDLGVALTKAAKELHGAGGGHNIAAGATIPKGKEEEFLDLLESNIKTQLAL
ncbi:MAG: DHH family phosphoesterase [Candidatus Thermoplasmatota archaeon]|nr:DHH family phosphoesterase [Candidatus Thermoplasmatota archaeon]